jgi:hypothetical protein
MRFFDLEFYRHDALSPRFKPWAKALIGLQFLLLFSLINMVLLSCQEPIKEFEINSDVEHRTV